MNDARVKTVLYLDMWVGERIQEMKLTGIRRFARMAGWNVVPVSERESRPGKLRALLKRHRPDGIIVECSAARTDLPPRRFGRLPVVYLDSSRTLYGPGVARSVHDYKLTLKTAMRELSSNRPECYGFVGYREKRVWSAFRERGFKVLAKETGRPCRIFKRERERAEVRARRLAAWVADLPRKSAVLAANDDTALEIVSAAKAAHRAIPRDFTLLSIDNLEDRCLGCEPTISSIQVDWERAGYLAARLLNGLMTGRTEPKVVKFGPLLTVHRQSTRGYGRLRAAGCKDPGHGLVHSGARVRGPDGAGCHCKSRRFPAAGRTSFPRSRRSLDSRRNRDDQAGARHAAPFGQIRFAESGD